MNHRKDVDGPSLPFFHLSKLLSRHVYTLPVYTKHKAHFVLYWLAQLGAGGGPLIPIWTAELTGGDNEARAINLACGNDFAGACIVSISENQLDGY